MRVKRTRLYNILVFTIVKTMKTIGKIKCKKKLTPWVGNLCVVVVSRVTRRTAVEVFENVEKKFYHLNSHREIEKRFMKIIKVYNVYASHFFPSRPISSWNRRARLN